VPFYEYKCETCGHECEKLMKMSSPDPACPECKKNAEDAEAELPKMTKKVSVSGFKLEGGGWYKDGYG
jgi:putative FmdB family regulatory protein